MRRVKILILSLLAAFALSSIAASAALALPEFMAERYPVVVTASSPNNGFKIAGATAVCMNATFTSASLMEKSTTLRVLPSYTECETELAGTHATTVVMKGCEYVFHAAAVKTKEGTVDISCPAGAEIEVQVSGLTGCVIKVKGGQEGLKSVEYINGGTGAKRRVQVRAEVEGIKWSATAGCKLAQSEGSNGEYRLGKLPPPELEPAGHPVVATAAGYEPGHEGVEADEIGVFVE